MKLRGPAKAIDLQILMNEMERVISAVKNNSKKIQTNAYGIQQNTQKVQAIIKTLYTNSKTHTYYMDLKQRNIRG